MKLWAIGGAGALILAAAGPALAHVGHAAGPLHDGGFAAGLAHPLTGADHVLAMLAVGLWAGIAGGRAALAWPASFLALMVAAAFAGAVGPFLAGVELAIAASVAALGVAVALRARAPVALGAALCGLFALAHGYAHGAELPFGAAMAPYVAGFALSTGALHALGLGIGTVVGRRAPAWTARASGGAVALAGVVLMVG